MEDFFVLQASNWLVTNRVRIWFEKETDISHDSVLGKGRNCLISVMLRFGEGGHLRNNSRYLIFLREVVFFS